MSLLTRASKMRLNAQSVFEPPEAFPTPITTLHTKLESGHTVFEGTLGGISIDIVFDTGMLEGLLISESVAKAAGLTRVRDFRFTGIGHDGATKAYIAGPTSITIGDIHLRSEVIVFPEDSTLGRSFCELQAVMGYTLLERYLVRVQPQYQHLSLFEPDATYRHPGKELDLVFDEKDRKISIAVPIAFEPGRIEQRIMTIDTGNGGAPFSSRRRQVR